MSRIRQIIIAVFVVLGVVYASMLALTAFLPVDRTCQSYPVMSISSPNNKLRVEQIQEQCDDDKELKTVVWLSEVGRSSFYGTRWGIFSANAARVSDSGTYLPIRLDVAWLNDREIQITYPRSAKVTMSDSEVNGVKVNFVESPDGSR